MGQLHKQESFGELSALLQLPFTCTVVAGEEVEAAIIQGKDLRGKHRIIISCNCDDILVVDHMTRVDIFHHVVRTLKEEQVCDVP